MWFEGLVDSFSEGDTFQPTILQVYGIGRLSGEGVPESAGGPR